MQSDTLDCHARLRMRRRKVLVELEAAGVDVEHLAHLGLFELEEMLAAAMRGLMAAPAGGR